MASDSTQRVGASPGAAGSLMEMANGLVRADFGDAFLQVLEFGTKRNPTHPQRMPKEFGAAGSSVVFRYDKEGDYVLIVSNAHVIADARTILVKHPSWVGGSVRVIPVGAHIRRDVSLLVLHDVSQIPGINAELQSAVDAWVEDLQPVDIFVDTDTPDIIDSVVIIAGYPLAETDLNLTQGHIGSRSTFIGRDVLKTSSAMNHGNSGGAAVVVQRDARTGDVFAEYVGIPSYGRSGTNSTGYIIPASEVSNIISFMLATPNNRITNPESAPFLNVEDPDFGVAMSFDRTLGGYRVQRIDPDSPFSAKDGSLLLVNDVVVAVNGVRVSGIAGKFQEEYTTQPFTLKNMIDATEFNGNLSLDIKRVGDVPLDALHRLAGDTVARILADTEVRTISAPWVPSVNLGVRQRWDGIEDTGYESFAGLYITEFKLQHLQDPVFASRARSLLMLAQASPQKRKEAVLIFVDVDKSMLRTGIRPGMIIRTVNGEEVHTVADYRSVLNRVPQDGTVLFGIIISPLVTELAPFPIPLRDGLVISEKVSKLRNERITEGTQQKINERTVQAALATQNTINERLPRESAATSPTIAKVERRISTCAKCSIAADGSTVYCSRMCKLQSKLH